MLDTIEKLKQEAIEKIENANNDETLREIELEYFGRKAGYWEKF